MSATSEGAKKAAQIIKDKHGADWYKKIGAKGGKKSRGGGFTGNPELAREVGKRGGVLSGISKRLKKENKT